MSEIESNGKLTFFSLPDDVVMPKFFTTVSIKAGFPSPAQDFMEEDIDIVAFLGMNKPSVYVVRMEDGGMEEQNIPEKSLLIVDRSLKAIPHDIVVAEFNGQFMVRTLIRSAAGWMLYGNSAHDPIVVREGDSFQIWGVVTQIIINLKTKVGPFISAFIKAGTLSTQPEGMYEFDLATFLGVNKHSVFIMRVDGDSMQTSHVPNESFLIVDRSITPMHNDIVAAVLNGDFTVKTLVEAKASWMLYPGNPFYNPIVIKEEDEFQVWGVIAQVIIDRKAMRKRFR